MTDDSGHVSVLATGWLPDSPDDRDFKYGFGTPPKTTTALSCPLPGYQVPPTTMT